MRLRWLKLLTCLICASIPALPAAAADHQNPRFAIIDWFPFGWVEDGRNVGMLVDMVKLYNRHLDQNLEDIVSPVPRVIRGMEEGDFDFTITYRDAGMLGNVDYLGDIGCLKSLIVSFKTHPVTSLDGLTGLTVGYPGGGYFAKRFAPYLDLQRVEVPQTFVMLNMALRGRLDALILNNAVLEAYKRDMFPGFTVPQERWADFAEPAVIEELPLAASMSLKSRFGVVAERMRALSSDPAFLADLREIYASYGVEHAMECLK